MKTAYEVLGLTREAILLDIEHSYHHALNMHGARSAGRPPRKEDLLHLRELREAYLVLSSPSRRHAYDLDLQACEQQRSRIIHVTHTALAVLSLLSGLLLIGAGFYSAMQRGKAGFAGAAPDVGQSQAIARSAPEPHPGTGIERADQHGVINRTDR